MMIFLSMTLPQMRRVVIYRKDLSTVLELMTTGIVMELISILKLLAIRYNQSGNKYLNYYFLLIKKNHKVKVKSARFCYSNFCKLTFIFISFHLNNNFIKYIFLLFAKCHRLSLSSIIQGLRWLLRRMVDDWKIRDKGEYCIMWTYAKLTNTIVTICIALTIGNIAALIIRLYATYIIERYYSAANETVLKPQIAKSDFYFNEQVEGIYELVVAAQILGGFSVAFSFTACDGFFVCSIMHVSGQIHILQMQIEDLVRCYEKRGGAFSEVLAPIVHRHRDLRGYRCVI